MRPLHFASHFAREGVLDQLLASGADVDAKDEGGNTPLHWAASKGVLSVATKLMEANCGLQTSNVNGATPMHKAANNGHVRLHRAVCCLSLGCG